MLGQNRFESVDLVIQILFKAIQGQLCYQWQNWSVLFSHTKTSELVICLHLFFFSGAQAEQCNEELRSGLRGSSLLRSSIASSRRLEPRRIVFTNIFSNLKSSRLFLDREHRTHDSKEFHELTLRVRSLARQMCESRAVLSVLRIRSISIDIVNIRI